MQGEIYLSDNAGNRVPPHPNIANPVEATGVSASGQTLTNASAATNTSASVVAGATYAFTAQKTGGFYFGMGNVITYPQNILWACPLYQTIIIVIPPGVTTVRYAVDTNSAVGYLRRLAI